MSNLTRTPGEHAAGPRGAGGVPGQRQRRRPAEHRGAAHQPRSRPTPARQRAGRWRGVTLAQLVAMEIALALLLIPLGRRRWLLMACAPAAVALLVLTLLRRRGRWLFEWFGVRRAQRRRQHQPGPPAPSADPNFGPVLECCPDLRTASVTDRNRSTVGIVGDGGFLTAVVLVESQDDPLRAGRGGAPLPLSVAAEVLRVDDIELASVQVVQHTQSAPATHLAEHAMAVRSYLELTGARVPGVRLTWVALKLEPGRCPQAVLARGGGEAGAHRALLKAVHQLRAELSIRGLRATPLTEHELTAALAASASVNPLVGAQGSQQHTARRTRETPRGWRCDDRWHVTYWASHWPSLAGTHGPELISVLSGVPALATSFALALAPDADGGFALAAHLRIVARSERGLAEASKLLETRGRQAGVGLVRLDGEQLPGVLATLPLGGAPHLGLT